MTIKVRVVAALAGHAFLWMLMLLALVGVLGLAGGLYLAIAPPLGSAAAAAITGAVLLVLVALAGFGIYRAVAEKRDKREKRSSEPPGLDSQMRPVLGDRATDWARDHTGAAIVGALSAGVLLAVSPGLRSLLTRAVGPVVTREAIRTVQRFSER